MKKELGSKGLTKLLHYTFLTQDNSECDGCLSLSSGERFFPLLFTRFVYFINCEPRCRGLPLLLPCQVPRLLLLPHPPAALGVRGVEVEAASLGNPPSCSPVFPNLRKEGKLHWKKKRSYFDLKSWVTGETEIRPAIPWWN